MLVDVCVGYTVVYCVVYTALVLVLSFATCAAATDSMAEEARILDVHFVDEEDEVASSS